MPGGRLAGLTVWAGWLTAEAVLAGLAYGVRCKVYGVWCTV